MELQDIKAKIVDLRLSIEELSDDCFGLWRETINPHVQSVAEYLQYELTTIASKLADLEETEESEDFTPDDGDSEDEAYEISDWWDNLELVTKCELANVPYPTSNYGRGDEYCECEDRCDKWWNSRTYEQKREIYSENLP